MAFSGVPMKKTSPRRSWLLKFPIYSTQDSNSCASAKWCYSKLRWFLLQVVLLNCWEHPGCIPSQVEVKQSYFGVMRSVNTALSNLDQLSSNFPWVPAVKWSNDIWLTSPILGLNWQYLSNFGCGKGWGSLKSLWVRDHDKKLRGKVVSFNRKIFKLETMTLYCTVLNDHAYQWVELISPKWDAISLKQSTI